MKRCTTSRPRIGAESPMSAALAKRRKNDLERGRRGIETRTNAAGDLARALTPFDLHSGGRFYHR